MALREDLRDSGTWLFRRRGTLPLVLAPGLLLVMANSHMAAYGRITEVGWELACVALALCGELLRIAAVGFSPRGSSEGNVVSPGGEVLNTDGVYSVLRHPLYVGNFLLWMGVALFPANGWFALAVMLGFCLYYERIMFAEEEFLRERYGPSYVEWAARTPAVLPRLAAWRPPARAFSLRRVLHREHSSVLAATTAFTVLDLFDHYAMEGRLVFDPVWGAAFTAVLIGVATVVTLKRSGRLRVDP